MLDANLLRYIWTHSRPQQLWILFVVLASMPTYYMSLDLPKLIVNGPIQGAGFEAPGDTQPFLRWTVELGGETYTVLPGIEFERMGMLFALSGLFLTLVLINGLFKFYINTYKGRLGERMLRRIRYALLDHVLRFPSGYFKRVKAAEVASMIKDEVEPLGGFIGDAYVQPVLLGGQALTAMAFIMAQNYVLGLIAISIIAIQFIIIPRLRRHLIRLNKERQITARQLAGRVSEVVDGINAVHLNHTSNYERADASSRLGRIFGIRFELYQRKFFIKFLNNLLAQITPFLFYAVGGYFALIGQLDVGQLVAVIAAYKDLPSPIKELIDWDQQRLDVQVKFQQVVEQFNVDHMLDPAAQAIPDGPVPELPFPLVASSLAITDDTGTRLLERGNLHVERGRAVALVGSANAGAEVIADALVRLHRPDSGRISYGDVALQDLPEWQLGTRAGYATADAFLPQGSVRANLLYVLMHRPLDEPAYEGALARQREFALREAARTGNSALDVRARWVAAEAEATAEIRRVLKIVALEDDILDLGLRGVADMALDAGFSERIVAARATLRERLSAPGLAGLVEPFDPAAYSRQATVAENLLFGTPVGDTFAADRLTENAYLMRILAETGLDRRMFENGIEIANMTLELFKDLPPDHPFFEQLSFMSADQIPDYQQVVQRVQGQPWERVSAEDRAMMVRLSLAYIEPRHRLGLLDDMKMERLLEARRQFREGLPDELRPAISFYDPSHYNPAASVQDNLLMGRVAHGAAGAQERVASVVRALLEELHLSEAVLNVGLDFNVGTAGKRLSVAQRHKLGIARAIIKKPDLLVLNRPLPTLDPRQQDAIVQSVLAEARRHSPPVTVVWALSQPAMARHFDEVYVFQAGATVEHGPPDKLLAKGGAYAKLLA